MRKVRVVIGEKNLDCPFTPENPRADGSEAKRYNPLGKVPVLAFADGTSLFDSPVIVEYLDALAEPRLLPAAGPARFRALRTQALADGLMDAAIRVAAERRRPETEQHADVLAWEEQRLASALTAVERGLADYVGAGVGIGEIALAVALAYIDWRLGEGWRGEAPSLAGWASPFGARASFRATTLFVSNVK